MAAEIVIADLRTPAGKRDLQLQIGRLEPGIYEVHLKRRHRGRTLPQNAAYWGMVVPALRQAIRETTGEIVTDEECHQMLKARFLRVETRIVNEATGETEPMAYTRSTSKLDAKEFSDYFDTCRDFLAQWFGVVIPDPDPYWRSNE